jgi:hypothetical protein
MKQHYFGFLWNDFWRDKYLLIIQADGQCSYGLNFTNIVFRHDLTVFPLYIAIDIGKLNSKNILRETTQHVGKEEYKRNILSEAKDLLWNHDADDFHSDPLFNWVSYVADLTWG